MYLVNIMLTTGLILLILAITVLSLCAVFASSRPEQNSLLNRNDKERRKKKTRNFPITCSDGTMVYFDRRLESDRGYA